jgi:hypothetical protein
VRALARADGVRPAVGVAPERERRRRVTAVAAAAADWPVHAGTRMADGRTDGS